MEQKTTTEHEPVYYTYKGGSETFFIEESALIELLAVGVLFCSRGYPTHDKCELVVACSDLFYWATADAEPLPYNQIEILYKAWKQLDYYGVERWCCFRRNLRPQQPIEDKWRADGLWDDELEALPKPDPS